MQQYPFGYFPPYMPPVFPKGEESMTLDEYRKWSDFMEDAKEKWDRKKKDEGDKNKKDPPKGRVFSKLETVMLLCVFGPFVGFGYTWLMVSMSKNFSEMMTTIIK